MLITCLAMKPPLTVANENFEVSISVRTSDNADVHGADGYSVGAAVPLYHNIWVFFSGSIFSGLNMSYVSYLP